MSQLKRFGRFLKNQDMFGHTIGVHYRGDSAYKTRLGALVTFATYFLMLIYLSKLSADFFDGSNQEEKGQRIKIDLFNEGPVILAENYFEIATFVYPPLPNTVGRLFAVQNYPNTGEQKHLKQKACDEEKLSKLDEFYIPRLGLAYKQVRQEIKCIEDEGIFLESESMYSNFASLHFLFEPCQRNQENCAE